MAIPAKEDVTGTRDWRSGGRGCKPVEEFIDAAAKDQKPFFVWYAPMLPHTPHNPPQRLLDKYKDQTPHLPIAKYWAMCEWFDESVGELMGVLEKRDLTRNTIVVYVTDNGWIQTGGEGGASGGAREAFAIRWRRANPDHDPLAGTRRPAPRRDSPGQFDRPVPDDPRGGR